MKIKNKINKKCAYCKVPLDPNAHHQSYLSWCCGICIKRVRNFVDKWRKGRGLADE